MLGSKDAPAGKGVALYQDIDGFYYLVARVRKEGFCTPFASLKDIELVHDVQFTGELFTKEVDWDVN